MAKKTATDKDIERLENELQGILENKQGRKCIQAFSEKIADTEKTYILGKKIKKLLAEVYNNRGIACAKLDSLGISKGTETASFREIEFLTFQRNSRIFSYRNVFTNNFRAFYSTSNNAKKTLKAGGR